ncbi:MAG: four helix bundle protein [Patescibacteria group bacterium]|nr:four helix bundle protein [Patescibacteria group bacterium]
MLYKLLSISVRYKDNHLIARLSKRSYLKEIEKLQNLGIEVHLHTNIKIIEFSANKNIDTSLLVGLISDYELFVAGLIRSQKMEAERKIETIKNTHTSGYLLKDRVFQYLLWIYPKIAKFPKNQRFTLGQRMENTFTDILQLIWKTNYTKDISHKRHIFQEASVLLDLYLDFIRLSFELQFISTKEYAHSSQKLAEIGRLM